jgi:hypothetical protein
MEQRSNCRGGEYRISSRRKTTCPEFHPLALIVTLAGTKNVKTGEFFAAEKDQSRKTILMRNE